MTADKISGDKAIQIKGITNTIYEHLRAQIITGELKGGQRLNEGQLSSHHGISRGPLREAFRLLENDNLVINFPRKGTYVTKISIKDFKHIYQTREMLECYAIDIFKEKQIRQFAENSNSIPASTPPPAPTSSPEEKLAYINENASFHVSLIEATGNPWVSKFYQTISTTLARCQFLYAFTPGMSQQAAQEHEELRQILRTGAYDNAKILMKAHINNFLELLLRQCHEENSEDPQVFQAEPIEGL